MYVSSNSVKHHPRCLIASLLDTNNRNVDCIKVLAKKDKGDIFYDIYVTDTFRACFFHLFSYKRDSIRATMDPSTCTSCFDGYL
jgi:hypothetical protein